MYLGTKRWRKLGHSSYPIPTVCLFWFVSVEIERLLFSAKNQCFFLELIHSRLHPVCELSSAVKKFE